MEKPITVLTKYDLKVFEFAGKDNSRPMLTHVLVRKSKNGVELVATDSYVAVVHGGLRLASDFTKPFLVPRDVLERLHKLAGRRRVLETNRTRRIRGKSSYMVSDNVELYEKYATIPTLGVRIDFDAGEQKPSDYPKLDALIKDNIVRDENIDAVALNTAYIVKASKFVSSHWLARGECKVRLNGELKPVEFYNDYTYAVVMPMKHY